MQNDWSLDKKEALLAAANLLILSPHAHELLDALNATFAIAKTHPIRLTGEAEPLNALMELRLTDELTYGRVLMLVEQRRHELGFDVLQRAKADNGFDKTAYMREFMAAKRERQRRAAALENMLRPARDALRGRARLDFMDRQSAKWKGELDALTEKARTANGGKLTKDQLDTIKDQFWSGVDAWLDEAEARARTTLANPVGLRPALTASLAQLNAALLHDPYKGLSHP